MGVDRIEIGRIGNPDSEILQVQDHAELDTPSEELGNAKYKDIGVFVSFPNQVVCTQFKSTKLYPLYNLQLKCFIMVPPGAKI